MYSTTKCYLSFLAGIYYWVLWRLGLQTDICGLYIATK